MAAADITALLSDTEGGDREAADLMLPLVYGQLEEMARRHRRGERAGHTLDTAALVHEAYLKLVDQTRAGWKSRSHFLGVASIAMRRILVNYARQRSAAKRDGGEVAMTLHDGDVGRVTRTDDLLALDEALDRLAKLEERSAPVVETWFFGGLGQTEIAAVLGVSEKTVRRDWQSAKASAEPVRMAVYDLLGREVLRLHDGPLAAGAHALEFDAAGLSAGLYVVRAASASGTAVRRVTVAR